MKNIGIKLADGSFYPVLQEGNAGRKQINLTTVKDNQTTVKVDLFRSENSTMEGAEYVDTLKITHLKKKPDGEPDLTLDLWLDSENHLNAELRDQETGSESHTSATLLSTIIGKDKIPGTGKGLLGMAQAMNAKEAQGKNAKKIADSLDDFTFDSAEDNDSLDETGITIKETPSTKKENADDFEMPGFDLPEFEGDAAPAEETTLQEEVPVEDVPLEDESLDEVSLDEAALSEPASFDEPTSLDDTSLDESPFDKNPFGAPAPLDDTSIDDAPVNEESLPSMDFDSGDFDLPDFPEQETGSEAVGANESLDDGFGENDSLDFSNLYENEKEESTSDSADTFEEEDEEKKTRLPMIICIICAAICIFAVLLLLFIIPSRFNLISSKKAKEKVVAEKPAPVKEVIKEEPPAPEKVEAPAAKEDEVVVVSQAENVVPDLPVQEEKPARPKEIIYKIKWGDTLWDLADAYYKNPWRYPKIARYNGIKNPDHIISGTYIKIPED